MPEIVSRTVSKIELGLSESRLLEMFKSMHADIPQATLNSWMHKVMNRLHEALQGPMLEEIRQNDETRIDIRSVTDGKEKYHTEYIHGCMLTECMFRHIAMGRRNWLHSGSHDGVRNIAFMYSLLGSSKLNGLDFGDYIEDVMTRLAEGDTDYASMIACNYKPRQAEANSETA